MAAHRKPFNSFFHKVRDAVRSVLREEQDERIDSMKQKIKDLDEREEDLRSKDSALNNEREERR